METREQNCINEDEIDLRELFTTLWQNKIFIAAFTAIITVAATVYAFTKTPIYEAKATLEVGEYQIIDESINSTSKELVDDVQELSTKLTTVFVDNQSKEQDAKIQSISVPKGQKKFLQITSHAVSNEKASKEIKQVVQHIKETHNKTLSDIQKKRSLKISHIDTKLAQLNKEAKNNLLLQKEVYKKNINSLEKNIAKINEHLSNIKDDNALLALLYNERQKLNNTLTENKLNLLELDIEINKQIQEKTMELTEKKQGLESALLPHNYNNSSLVDGVKTNDFPVKPKKKLIVVVAFVTGFILAVFLVFFKEFIKSFRQEDNDKTPLRS